MPKADTAADTEETNAPNEATDLGADGAEQTQGDNPEARALDSGRPAEKKADDSLADSDPLLLAQQEPTGEEKPKAEPAKPEAAEADPKTHATDQAREAKATPPKATTKTEQKPEPAKAKADEIDEDEELATQDLPPEDWNKLSHKAKSQFLAQRKVLKNQREATKTAKELAGYKDDYQLVEKFVRDQGLEDEEYKNGVVVAGLAKRNDPRVLPLLEETVRRIRKAANLPDPVATPVQQEVPTTPAAPAVDADELKKLLDEAEESFDFTKLRTLQTKLKAPAPPAPTAKAATPPAPAVPTQPAAVSAPRQPQTEVSQDEMSENMATINALVALGVPEPEVVTYARELIGEIAKAGQIPAVGARLQAVLRVHQARKSVAATPPKKPASAPLSNRGQDRVPVRRSDPNATADPLKHAMR